MIPAPSATFSPLTTQKPTPSSSFSAGQALLDRLPAGGAEDVGDEEDSQGSESVAGWISIATWFPASVVTRARAWRSTWAKSMIVPTLEVVAPTVEPTVRFGSGRTCVSETTSDGVAARLDVDPRAHVLPGQHVRRDPDDPAVDRRVDVGPGRRADVERGGGRAGAAAEHVVAQAVAAAVAEQAASDTPDEALVQLAPDRPQRERAVAGGVVADRGQPALGDREQQPDRAHQRDDLRPRRARGQQPGRRRGRRGRDRARAARPESGQEQRDQRDRGEQDQSRQSPLAARGGRLGPPSPRMS